MEPLFQEESGSANFGAKVVLSLNGVDPSFMNSVVGSYLQSQVAQISYMIHCLCKRCLNFGSLINTKFGISLVIKSQYFLLHFLTFC